jgi:hypothetical protein
MTIYEEEPLMLDAMVTTRQQLSRSMTAAGVTPTFEPGDRVRVAARFPIGHRVPHYIRGKRGRVEAVIEEAGASEVRDGLAPDTGSQRCRYRIVIPLGELWPEYAAAAVSGLRAEMPEAWLEPM